ncbi:hypothetical protein [Ruegeria sp.]|uniref:hypothetical protein n=1 Tax=Ruegeria sp. TaxID=1879320 RepID=UPI003B008149
MNMGEEVSHLKAHVNTFYNNGALQRASEQPHLKTNQKPSQINKKVGSQDRPDRVFPSSPTGLAHMGCRSSAGAAARGGLDALPGVSERGRARRRHQQEPDRRDL